MANIDIFGTLNNATPEGVIARADQIKDETQNKKQSEINAEVKEQIEQLSQQGGSGGGIEDAPTDGKVYGRKSRAWSPITIPEGETIIDLGEINFNPSIKSPEGIFVNMVTKPGLYRFTTPYYYSNGLLLAQESRDIELNMDTRVLIYSLWITYEPNSSAGNPSYVLYAVSTNRHQWRRASLNMIEW